MSYTCLKCKKGTARQKDPGKVGEALFGKVTLCKEKHTLFVISYNKNPLPYVCDNGKCNNVFLTGVINGANRVKKADTEDCPLCGEENGMELYRNVDVGDICVRDGDDLKKVGDFTVDEARICKTCKYIFLVETGADVGDD